MTKYKIGVAHPKLGQGGSEARALWCIEALKDVYDVSLITGGNINIDEANRFYGTLLNLNEFDIHRAPLSRLLDIFNGGDAIRGANYQRYCRKIAKEYDLLISAYNICNFGVPGIQCLADFSWDEEISGKTFLSPKGLRGLFHRNKLLRAIYLHITERISKPFDRELKFSQDLILANSYWSAKILREKYGVETEVLYPPVLNNFYSKIPKKEKMGFVCIGRIAPEKRIEKIIEILRKVRRIGFNIHLHIIGDTTKTLYGKYIEKLCKAERKWIILEGIKYGEDKFNILCQHNYGIHACAPEAFGIAVAEMIKAGCITFVPNNGGQTEIVNHPILIYDSETDAIKKIVRVIIDSKLQVRLKNHLYKQAKLFSVQKFINNIRKIVYNFLQNRK